MELNGKTMCGRSVTDLVLTVSKPDCGQCARNLRTMNGRMRDGRGALSVKFNEVR